MRLNFKNDFNSFNEEMNEEGPKIITFNLCIFLLIKNT